jgi:hypothetical protein
MVGVNILVVLELLKQALYALNATNEYQDLDIGRIDNAFVHTAVDKTGMVLYAPYDLDTSAPLTVRISFIAQDTGDFVFWVNFGITSDGDTVQVSDAAAPTSISAESHESKTITITTAYEQQTEIFELDVSNVISRRSSGHPDIMWITLARNPADTEDNLADAVDIIQVSPYYVQWSEGSHE